MSIPPERWELEREAGEVVWNSTYEERYRVWCESHLLDPEDLSTVLGFEELMEERLQETRSNHDDHHDQA